MTVHIIHPTRFRQEPIRGQDEPVETITVKATIVVSESLDEDTVYDMTAAIFDHADEISAENAKGAELSLENALPV